MKVQIRPIETKTFWQELATQGRELWQIIAICLFSSGTVLAAIGVMSILFDRPFAYFTRDPGAAVAGGTAPSYAGALSNLGVLVMAVAATVTLYSAWLLYHGKGRNFWFIAVSGLITAWLVLDDLFQLHEEVIPDYLRVPEELVYVLYGGMMLGYLFYFATTILQTEYLLLTLALGFFAMSIALDIDILEFAEHLIEDGAKFAGMTLWCAYFLRLSWGEVRPMIGKK